MGRLGGVKIGRLDRRIELQKLTIGTSTKNVPTESYSTVQTVWASREEVSGSEGVISGSETAFTGAIYNIRYNSNFATSHRNEAWRIKDENEYYNIVRIDLAGRNVAHRVYTEKWTEETY